MWSKLFLCLKRALQICHSSSINIRNANKMKVLKKEKKNKKLKSTRACYTELKHILAVSTQDCNIIVQLWRWCTKVKHILNVFFSRLQFIMSNCKLLLSVRAPGNMEQNQNIKQVTVEKPKFAATTTRFSATRAALK